MEAYQERVVQERADLDEKWSKLGIFMGSPTFRGLPEAERSRLARQYEAMRQYAVVLDERIAAFNEVR